MKRSAILLTALAAVGLGLLQEKPDRVFKAAPEEIQIRAYADRGAVLPSGEIGGAVQVYGMRVGADGSETVVWKRFIFQFNGLLFPHVCDLLLLEEDRVVLYFPRNEADRSARGVYELNRKTGRLLKHERSERRPSAATYQAHGWIRMTIVDRPAVSYGVQDNFVKPRE